MPSQCRSEAPTSAAQIAEAVRVELQTLYPHDQAVDYTPGELRGAVSIRQPLEN